MREPVYEIDGLNVPLSGAPTSALKDIVAGVNVEFEVSGEYGEDFSFDQAYAAIILRERGAL